MERNEKLARGMFEAYNEKAGGKTFDGRPIPPFDQIGVTQENWKAAADYALDFCQSDGYHTIDQLYAHRNELFYQLAVSLQATGKAEIWKSRKNSEGIEDKGWIIVQLVPTLFIGARISYHLPESYWERLPKKLCVELEQMIWDGHTSDDVLERMSDWTIADYLFDDLENTPVAQKGQID